MLSDVHGNLPALECILKKERDADLVISLGDVVNYGPWSDQCVRLLDELPRKTLLKGNHEDAFIAGSYEGRNKIARAFFDFCYPRFKSVDRIAAYIDSYSYCGFDFLHTLPPGYIFPDTDVELDNNTMIGHSHRAFMKRVGAYLLVNAGSVGQNRSNADQINYVIWFPAHNEIKMMTVDFSSELLLAEMRSQRYPAECIKYIESKRLLRS